MTLPPVAAGVMADGVPVDAVPADATVAPNAMPPATINAEAPAASRPQCLIFASHRLWSMLNDKDSLECRQGQLPEDELIAGTAAAEDVEAAAERVRARRGDRHRGRGGIRPRRDPLYLMRGAPPVGGTQYLFGVLARRGELVGGHHERAVGTQRDAVAADERAVQRHLGEALRMSDRYPEELPGVVLDDDEVPAPVPDDAVEGEAGTGEPRVGHQYREPAPGVHCVQCVAARVGDVGVAVRVEGEVVDQPAEVDQAQRASGTQVEDADAGGAAGTVTEAQVGVCDQEPATPDVDMHAERRVQVRIDDQRPGRAVRPDDRDGAVLDGADEEGAPGRVPGEAFGVQRRRGTPDDGRQS